jgi:sugar-phosphatase
MTHFTSTGFLFDCDGVLADSLESAAGAWDAWSARHAPHFDFRRDHVHGRRAGDTVAELVAQEHRHVAERALELLEIEHVGSTAEIAGAGALLRALPADRWAVVTSGTRVLARMRLTSAAVPMPRFLITAEDVTHGKPHPEPYLAGASAIGIDPARCVVFEDAPAGIVAAIEAGVGVVIGVGMGAVGTAATCVIPDLTAASYRDGFLQIDDAVRLD